MKKLILILIITLVTPVFPKEITIEADSEDISYVTTQLYFVASSTGINKKGLLPLYRLYAFDFLQIYDSPYYPDKDFESGVHIRKSYDNLYSQSKFFHDIGFRLLLWDDGYTIPIQFLYNFGFQYDLSQNFMANASIGYCLAYTFLEFEENTFNNVSMRYNLSIGLDFRIPFHDNPVFKNTALIFGIAGKYESTFVEIWNKNSGQWPNFYNDRLSLEFKFGFESKSKIINIPFE